MAQAANPVRAARAPFEETPALDRTAAVQRPPYRLALAAAAVVFALYALTVGPTTWFWDTSEYITTAHILGIPHPPGNPLFVLLARAWELMLAPTGLPTAVRINLFSALMSAGTAFFWYLTVHRILGFIDSREGVRRVGAAAAVLLSATAYTVWNQSNINEKVYTVSMFTIAVLTWLAFLWRDHVEEHQGVKGAGAARFHDDNVLVLMVFILALSVANHLMVFLAAPALVLFALLVKPKAFLNGRLYLFAVLFGFLGLSVHLFLSIRAGLHPIINEASPTCPSTGSAILSILGFGKIDLPGACENLNAALAREQYQKPSIFDRQSPFSYQMLNYFQYFDWQWARSLGGERGYFGSGARLFVTLLFTILGGLGWVEHWRRDRKSFAYMAVLFATLSVGLVIYMNFKYGYMQIRTLGESPELSEVRERDYFFLVSFSLWGLYAGVGLTTLWLQVAEAVRGGGKRSLAFGSPVLAVALVPLVLNWPYASRRGDYTARDLAYNMLMSVEPYGVLFTNGDNDTFPLWYVQEVEGIRRDVTVIVLSYLNTDWYPKQLRDLTRPCPQGPEQALEDPTRIICQRPFQLPEGAPAVYDGSRRPAKAILPFTDAEIDQVAAPPSYIIVPQAATFEARGMRVPIEAGQPLMASDQFVLAIIKHAWGDRPIHFASTTNVQFDLGLYPFITRAGMSFKLVTPEESAGLLKFPEGQSYSPVLGQYMDVSRNERLVNDVFMLRGVPGKAHWTDDATRNIPIHYMYAYLALAQAKHMQNDTQGAQRYEGIAGEFEELSKR